MSVKGKNHISMMLDLCRSILESAGHLAAQKDIRLLKPDTITGLQTLEDSLSCFKADASIRATKLLKACIENDIYLYDTQFHAVLQHWLSSISETISSLWTTEALKCPICDAAGVPVYMASLYQNTGSEASASLTRFLLQCPDCRNYYAVKNNPYPAAEYAASMKPTSKYKRMAEIAENFIEDGFLLYAGEHRSMLSDILSYDTYILQSCSLQQLEKVQGASLSYGRYHALFIDDLLLAADIEGVLTKALEYVADSGILWFEIPDMELALQRLSEEGIPFSFASGSDVFLHPFGIDELKNRLGFYIISYRRVDDGGMIEFIVGKGKVCR